MLRNFKQHTNTFWSVQNIYTHSSMNFFLAIYCCAYTIQWHHLDSTLRRGARGSPLFWLDFSSSDLGLSRSSLWTACLLFKMYGCVNVCVCTYSPTSIGSLFLFSFCFQLFLRIWFHVLPRQTVLNLVQGSSVTSGDLIQNLVSAHTKYLCVHLHLILHFEVGVSVTTDFPVNWFQCQRPWKHPIFEGVFFANLSLLRRLPLKGCLRCCHNLFQFLRTERVERWRRTESESFLGLKVVLEGFVGKLGKFRLVLSQASLRCQIKCCI